MKKIYSLFEQYGNVDAGDLSSNQKKEMYSLLKTMSPEELTTVEEHKMYVQILKKLRQSSMDEMQLLGKKFVATLESPLAVGEDGDYSHNQRVNYE